MNGFEAFVPAVLSQLGWSVGMIFAAAVGVSVHDTVNRVRARWGFIGFKPRYAVAYLHRRGLLA